MISLIFSGVGFFNNTDEEPEPHYSSTYGFGSGDDSDREGDGSGEGAIFCRYHKWMDGYPLGNGTSRDISIYYD